MPQPTNLEEFNRRALDNSIVISPCPFCAAPSFMFCKASEAPLTMAIGATCRECGRSAKAIFHGDTFELVQTGGAEQPAWLEPKLPQGKP